MRGVPFRSSRRPTALSSAASSFRVISPGGLSGSGGPRRPRDPTTATTRASRRPRARRRRWTTSPKASSPKVAASDVAAVVAAVAADLAGGVAVSVDAPLLDAGIDSIAAVEFVTTVQSAVGVPLDVSEVATLPTMGAIVERVTNAVAAAGGGGGGGG